VKLVALEIDFNAFCFRSPEGELRTSSNPNFKTKETCSKRSGSPERPNSEADNSVPSCDTTDPVPTPLSCMGICSTHLLPTKSLQRLKVERSKRGQFFQPEESGLITPGTVIATCTAGRRTFSQALWISSELDRTPILERLFWDFKLDLKWAIGRILIWICPLV